MSSALRTAIVAGVAVALAGCSSLNLSRDSFRIFQSKQDNASAEGAPAPAVRERISVLALDQQLKIADALKAKTFTLPPAAPQADWQLPGGTPEQSVEHVDAGAAFQIAWRSRIGKGSSRLQHITAPPVIAGGRVYTMDAGVTVSATDAVTGRAVWRSNLIPKTLPSGERPDAFLPPIWYGNGPIDTVTYGGGVAFADGKIFVASGYRFMAAIDAATGALLWRTYTQSPLHSAPTVTGGRVFAVSVDNELQSFDMATGQAGWTHQALVEPARILAASSPAVSGDAIVTAFSSGEVTALRSANGNELWPANLTRVSRTTALSEIRDIPGRPVIYRGNVYAGSHSGVFAAIDFRTGETRWELPIITMSTPWPVGDVVYIVSKAGEVICAARDTGQVYWIRDLNEGRKVRSGGLAITKRQAATRAYWSGVLLASNRLITVSSDGDAVALNPLTGEVLGTLRLPGGALITPIAAGGMIYVVTDNGQLVAIR